MYFTQECSYSEKWVTAGWRKALKGGGGVGRELKFPRGHR